MQTEGVGIEFTTDGLRRIAETAWQVNERTENIGARRLHTVMERLMEEIAFDAPDKSGTRLNIDAGYVDGKLEKLAGDQDLSRYIL
jgi:ATP-dependent HslUV protease ATP-binding subunit HslU